MLPATHTHIYTHTHAHTHAHTHTHKQSCPVATKRHSFVCFHLLTHAHTHTPLCIAVQPCPLFGNAAALPFVSYISYTHAANNTHFPSNAHTPLHCCPAHAHYLALLPSWLHPLHPLLLLLLLHSPKPPHRERCS